MIDLDIVLARMPSRQTLVLAAVVLVVVGTVVAGVWYWHVLTERQAAVLYASALAEAQATRGPQATADARASAARALEAALQAYPSAAMAAQAAFELGTLRHATQQYAAARSAYEIALARGATSTLRTVSKLGVAYAWEAERNMPKAVEAYQAAVASLKPGDAFYEQALLDLARVHEVAGRKDEAIATYRRALKDVPHTARSDEVRLRLASLGATP